MTTVEVGTFPCFFNTVPTFTTEKLSLAIADDAIVDFAPYGESIIMIAVKNYFSSDGSSKKINLYDVALDALSESIEFIGWSVIAALMPTIEGLGLYSDATLYQFEIATCGGLNTGGFSLRREIVETTYT